MYIWSSSYRWKIAVIYALIWTIINCLLQTPEKLRLRKRNCPDTCKDHCIFHQEPVLTISQALKKQNHRRCHFMRLLFQRHTSTFWHTEVSRYFRIQSGVGIYYVILVWRGGSCYQQGWTLQSLNLLCTCLVRPMYLKICAMQVWVNEQWKISRI